MFDFISHYERVRLWSLGKFGPGLQEEQTTKHIRRKSNMITKKPDDANLWVELATFALDGAMRAGLAPEGLAAALVAKQHEYETSAWQEKHTGEKPLNSGDAS